MIIFIFGLLLEEILCQSWVWVSLVFTFLLFHYYFHFHSYMYFDLFFILRLLSFFYIWTPSWGNVVSELSLGLSSIYSPTLSLLFSYPFLYFVLFFILRLLSFLRFGLPLEEMLCPSWVWVPLHSIRFHTYKSRRLDSYDRYFVLGLSLGLSSICFPTLSLLF